MTSKRIPKNYLVSDWLALHEISIEQMISLLGLEVDFAVPKQRPATAQVDQKLDVTPKTAWSLVSEALLNSFPYLRNEINEVEKHCLVRFDRDGTPYTLDRGMGQTPEIGLQFNGSPSDFLDLAHEFSHALQLVSKKTHFIPPIVREIAAFLGELALLDHLAACSHPMSVSVAIEWQHQNKLFLGEDLLALNGDLRRPAATYNYRQNYPPARILAYLLFRLIERKELCAVFGGKWSLNDCLAAIPTSTKEPHMKNYLPEIPEKHTDLSAIEAYRSLGMMTLLDLDYWKGQSEKSIEEYYAGLLKHMQSQTSYVVIGNENKPIGYATWNIDTDNPDVIEITRQAAPFGDHLQLQKSLRARLPDVRAASATHERSARREQVAW